MLIIIYLFIGLLLGAWYLATANEIYRSAVIFLMYVFIWPITLILNFFMGGDL
jgi:hypothetical protein